MEQRKTNEHNCILRHVCKLAGNAEHCQPTCPSFIALMGASGRSGRVAAANVPEDYRLITLKDSPVRASQPDAYSFLDEYVATFRRELTEIKSLYMVSASPGTGKTTTAAALLNEYIVAHYVNARLNGQQPLQRPGYFLDVNQLQTDYNGFNRPRVPDNIAQPIADRYYKALGYAKQAPFCVLDDLAVRDCTEGFRADLHSIVNHRVTNKLPTIYTSNLPISELSKVFGEARLTDRIGDRCATIPFAGTSKRGRR